MTVRLIVYYTRASRLGLKHSGLAQDFGVEDD